MSKKYIIEVEPVIRSRDGSGDLWRAKNFNTLVFDRNGLDKLKKYDDEDYRQYRRGYKEGIKDAWHAAQKLILPPSKNGFSTGEIKKIFGNKLVTEILGQTSGETAVTKIHDYEIKKATENVAKIGEEVINHRNERYIIYRVDKNHKIAYGMDFFSTKYPPSTEVFPLYNVTKTGRFFDDIRKVFAQQGECDDTESV